MTVTRTTMSTILHGFFSPLGTMHSGVNFQSVIFGSGSDRFEVNLTALADHIVSYLAEEEAKDRAQAFDDLKKAMSDAPHAPLQDGVPMRQSGAEICALIASVARTMSEYNPGAEYELDIDPDGHVRFSRTA